MSKSIPTNVLMLFHALLSFVTSALIFILHLADDTLTKAFLFAGIGAVMVLAIGIFNTILLISSDYENSRNRKSYYLISYSGSLAIYLALRYLFSYISNIPSQLDFTVQIILNVLAAFSTNTIIVGLQNFLLLQIFKSNAEREILKLRAANAEAAIFVLKQQIHPHFLFNSLNTLKLLYKKNTEKADEYLVHLADFLRASIDSQQNDISSLKNELILLCNYIEMQKIRFGSALTFTIDIPDDQIFNKFIPTFSLQPLLENAIKHNEVTEEVPLHVSVNLHDDRIVVTNNIQRKLYLKTSTGFGLANLAERFKLLADDDILINDDGLTFSVSIKLIAHADSNH
ncbi:MAG: histidine kinase [Chryseobacterium sp.]|nr:MAG: histidine kinase [Chryseobacterium sp.]